MSRTPILLAGTSNLELAEKIAKYLGLSICASKIKRFSDGETMVEIDENVRNKDVFVIQSTCPPVNDNLMELLILMDALKRASANTIAAVIPYYGYARQDRKVAPRAPISAKLVANLITVAGATRVLTIDLHAGQIQGFFDIPVDNLYATPVFINYLKDFIDKNVVMVSPDAGGVERARAYAKRLNAGLAIIDKRREKPNQSEVMNIIGDVKDKITILVDDMIDTAGSLCNSAEAVSNSGAKKIYAIATHPVFSGPAIERIENSKIDEVIVTDTIPLSERARKCNKIKVVTISGLIGEGISRIMAGDSLSALFV
ncbi:MAG: ribose-phosphate pyrophosphokinase [Proteobacteria bacterium]|nr:ribose-phosphate pyrophosphokinase [Pseudomonadota bacterium]